jgi:hypothetical protein
LIAIHSGAQETGPGPGGVKLSAYPNPATSYITFEVQKGYQKGLTIIVFNFLGKKMTQKPNATEKTTIDLNDYARGVYVYQVVDQGGKVIDTGKFQVSR